MTINCPYCECLSEKKPQLREIVFAFGGTYFRCEKCKKVFELVDRDEEDIIMEKKS